MYLHSSTLNYNCAGIKTSLFYSDTETSVVRIIDNLFPSHVWWHHTNLCVIFYINKKVNNLEIYDSTSGFMILYDTNSGSDLLGLIVGKGLCCPIYPYLLFSNELVHFKYNKDCHAFAPKWKKRFKKKKQCKGH